MPKADEGARVGKGSRLAPPRRMTSRAALRLDRAAATLGLVVLTDSAMEHYRGGLYNRFMFAAPFLSAATLGATSGRKGGRPLVHGAAVAGGLIGTAFHLRNVVKREGKLSWLNVLYGAPIGAPLGLTFAGIFGLAANRVRQGRAKCTACA